MSKRESEDRHLAVAANGDDMLAQVDALESELRRIHTQLDGVLCAVESLLRSPALTPEFEGLIRHTLEPASKAIASGAGRLRDQVECPDVAAGW